MPAPLGIQPRAQPPGTPIEPFARPPMPPPPHPRIPPAQVDFLTDQQRKTEAELELREKKITDLSRQKVCVCVRVWGGLINETAARRRGEEKEGGRGCISSESNRANRWTCLGGGYNISQGARLPWTQTRVGAK